VRSPLSSPRLRRIVAAYTVNRLGTWFGFVALSVAVFDHTHSAAAVAALLDELTQTLPASTVFEQAGAVCEVLEHAPGSRMVFITGDLDDSSAESLMRMLAHRHPELPVLVVDNPTRDDRGHIARHEELHIRHG